MPNNIPNKCRTIYHKMPSNNQTNAKQYTKQMPNKYNKAQTNAKQDAKQYTKQMSNNIPNK